MIVGGLGFLGPQRQVYNDIQPKLSSRSVFAPVRPGDRRLNSKITSNAVLNLMAYGCFIPSPSLLLATLRAPAGCGDTLIDTEVLRPFLKRPGLRYCISGLYVLAVLA